VKITDIRATTVAIPLHGILRYAQGVHPGRLIRTIVEVDTDQGITGLGEIGGSGASSDAAIATLAARLIGHDPMASERLRWVAQNPVEAAAYEDLTQVFAAIEFACLDIQGKALGVPVYTLLGGAMRQEIPFAAYLFFQYEGEDSPAQETAEDMVTTAQRLCDVEGFQVIKLKGGVFSPDHEVSVMEALRDAFPHHALRIDPNSNWSTDEAIRLAPRLESVGVEYYEDPCWGLAGLARLREKTRLPVATNTVVVRRDHIASAVAMRAVDIVLVDPHFFGGIRACTLAAAICETFGLGVSMHSSGELGISMAAMLHSAAAMSQLAFAADAHYHHLVDDVIVGGKLAYDGGTITVPSGPGLGVELDPDRVGRYHEDYQRLGTYAYIGDPRRPNWIPMIPEHAWPAVR
jgi:glucarate dehydratase